MFFAVLAFGALAFGSQAVLSQNFKFQLSQVEQCEPVSITFVGNDSVAAIPMWLTFIPFNSSPISIPIPNAAANTSGVYVTFVPFAEGTTFVASLDDASGENVAKVSDITRVLPSPTANTMCLPSVVDTAPKRFVMNGSCSQCEEFNVTYDRTVISRAPSVRFYNPKGPSRLLNLTADRPETGVATYLMSFERNKEVVLLFDDGFNHRETTPLITVKGDSTSSQDCLAVPQGGDDKGPGSDSPTSSPGISRGVIIGGAIGGGAIFLLSICMVLFIIRERRRRRRPSNIDFNPALLEKGPPSTVHPSHHLPPASSFEGKNLSPGFVKDPPYTAERFLSPTNSSYPRSSMASWAQAIPGDQKFSGREEVYNSRQADDRLSLNSLDIEGILNMAAVHSNRSSRQGEPAPLGPTFRSPAPSFRGQNVIPRPFPARGHLRDPSDVPIGPSSMALSRSSFSTDPFISHGAAGESDGPRPLNHRTSFDSTIRPPPEAIVSLPSSPRGRERVTGAEGIEISSPKFSDRDRNDNARNWYGIAQ